MSDLLTATAGHSADGSPVQPSPAPAPKYAKLKKFFYGLIGLILGGISILKFVTRNDLPGCEYQKTKEVIASIFKEKNVAFKTFNDATTVSTTDDLITCKSSVAMTDGTLLLDYKISRLPDDKFEVSITSARAQ